MSSDDIEWRSDGIEATESEPGFLDLIELKRPAPGCPPRRVKVRREKRDVPASEDREDGTAGLELAPVLRLLSMFACVLLNELGGWPLFALCSDRPLAINGGGVELELNLVDEAELSLIGPVVLLSALPDVLGLG